MKLLYIIFFIFIFGNSLTFATDRNNDYNKQEIIDSGHRFFGKLSGGLAIAIENIFKNYGLPNGYLLGEEMSGAFLGGITYGEGILYTKNKGQNKIFWQGPSFGWDFGGNGSRVMMLIYNIDYINKIIGRYIGISGSAYFVAGVGFNVLKYRKIFIIPIRAGIGARIGINFGYLKLTLKPTWNPI